MSETLYLHRDRAAMGREDFRENMIHVAPDVLGAGFKASWCFQLENMWNHQTRDEAFRAHNWNINFVVRVPDDRLVEWIILMNSGGLVSSEFEVKEDMDWGSWCSYRRISWLRYELYGSWFFKITERTHPVRYIASRENKHRLAAASSSRYERVDFQTWLKNTHESNHLNYESVRNPYFMLEVN